MSGRSVQRLGLAVLLLSVASVSLEILTREPRTEARPQLMRLPAHLLQDLETAPLLRSPLIGPSGRPSTEGADGYSVLDFEDATSVVGWQDPGVSVRWIDRDEQGQGGCVEIEATPGGHARLQVIHGAPTSGFLEVAGKIRLHTRLSAKEVALALREVRRLPQAYLRAQPSSATPRNPAVVEREGGSGTDEPGWIPLLPDRNAINILSYGVWQPFSMAIRVPEGTRSLRVVLDVTVPLFSVRFDDLLVRRIDPLAIVDAQGRYRYAAGTEITAPLRKMVRAGTEDRLSLLCVPGTSVGVDVLLEAGSRLDFGAMLWLPGGFVSPRALERRLRVTVSPKVSPPPFSETWTFDTPVSEWRELSLDLSRVGSGPARIVIEAPAEAEDWREPPYLVIADPVVSAPRPPESRVHGLLLVTLDALSTNHVHAFGYERETTPFIDGLASRGVSFPNATAPSPSTYTSLPGILASSHRRDHWQTFAVTLTPETPTLPEAFTAGGHLVAAYIRDFYFNSFFKGFFRRSYPFAAEWHSNEAIDELLVDELIAWVRAVKDRRFFAWIHTNQPHGPNRPSPEHDLFRIDPAVRVSIAFIDQYYRTVGVPGAKSMEEAAEQISLKRRVYPRDLVRHAEVVMTALYDGAIHQADSLVGRLQEALRAEGLLEQVVITISSDHGWPLTPVLNPDIVAPDGELVVPLILAGPGIPAGRRVAERVSTIDIAPTLLALAGIEPPVAFEGVRLTPLFAPGGTFPRRLVPAQSAEFVVGYEGSMKLVLTRELFDREGAIPLPAQGAWLFDLESDPEGRVNILARHLDRARELAARLGKWYAEGPRTFRTLELTEVMKGHLRAAGYLKDDDEGD
ncbi:MAG: sulfatase-like hydrolase/transferase [Planctomycetota bacterium]